MKIFVPTDSNTLNSADQLYAIPVFGNVSLLHFTDCHAQLLPIYYREPSINLGVGSAAGKVPHLVGAPLLNAYGVKAGSRQAYAFSHLDFCAAARAYGKVGGFAHLATLVKRMKASRPQALLLDGGDSWQGSATAQLTPRFSTNRSVREYTEKHYLPAVSAYLARAADQGRVGVDMVKWRHALEQKWAAIRFGEMKLETNDEKHVFEVQMYLDDLAPEAVRVELYANGVNGSAAEQVEMKRVRQQVGAENGYAYRAEVPATRLATDYTARLIPHRDGVAVPLEAAHILWQR